MALGAELVGQLDHLGDWGVLATDAELVVTGWNRWLVQRTGMPTAAVLGRPLFDLFPDLRARRLDRYYREALAGHPVVLSQRLHAYVLPLRPSLPAGGLAHMQQSVRIIPIGNGPDVSGTVTLIEDVTERVTHENALRARARQQAAIAAVARTALAGREAEDIARAVVELVSETLGIEFAEVLEALPAGAGWVRLAGCGWSKPAVRVFEPPAAPRVEAARSSDSQVETDDPAADARLAADDYLRAHGVGAGVVIRVPGHEGRPVRLLGAYSRTHRRFIPDETAFLRALADVLGMAVDRKRLEGELRLRARDLAEADRRKDEFLAMLAHELRNPLAPVRNGLQILRIAGDNLEVVDRTRDMLERQVQHLSRLVDDLMDVSRITRGRVELRTQPVDLAELAGRAVEEVRALIEVRKHRLTIAHHAGPVRVSGDPVRLTQVMANLLNNAAKYTDEGGEITLSVERAGNHAIVRVRDTGVGISAEMLARVFDLFTQVDNTLDRAQGGLGIGLTLVKSLVEQHGGQVEVASEGVGLGSEFVVRLPVLSDAPGSAPADKDDSGPAPARRVLVVDDNRDSAESLATLLQLGGHEVATAHNGPRALEVATEFRPEVVLLDIGLPGMSGYEVARALRDRAELRGTLVVAMTGYGQDADRQRSCAAGIDHHLVKPLEPRDVRRILSVERISK
jgi:signal transduction histidine kinase/ActR/RegA family two-component response regulator